MAKLELIGTFAIPTFAVCAIEYGDFSGVNDEDQKEIEDFLSSNFPKGFIADWKEIENPYFCTFPSFGMATDCIDVDFYLPN